MRAPELHAAWIDASGQSGAIGDTAALFPWWSFTKTVIAVCALRLAAETRLDLDARLPGRPYSLRHLLQHRAGIPDYGALAEYHRAVARGEDAWPRHRLFQKVRPDALSFAPGTGWAYSNIGYMLVRDVIEERSGRPFSALADDWIARPLGLDSARLAITRADFAEVHWSAARNYDPGWVYHGCLIGTAPDAAAVLHAAMTGDLLPEGMRAAMCATVALGDAVTGRPWGRHGYGLGVMSGDMGEAGRAVGHSGAGPFGVNAVYHFPDRGVPRTVAAFAEGPDEGVAEWEAGRLARRT